MGYLPSPRRTTPAYIDPLSVDEHVHFHGEDNIARPWNSGSCAASPGLMRVATLFPDAIAVRQRCTPTTITQQMSSHPEALIPRPILITSAVLDACAYTGVPTLPHLACRIGVA
jgi:hypothetical protein